MMSSLEMGKNKFCMQLFLWIGLFFLLSITVGCANTVLFDDSFRGGKCNCYRGQAIDSQTLQPIEGAVVLGVWTADWPTPAGTISSYYNSRETLTDENGEFQIEKVDPNGGLRIVIFKVGYEDIDDYWQSLKKDYSLLYKAPVILV